MPYCDEFKTHFDNLKYLKYPVWLGEWALGTDVCAMWLGSFNDADFDPQFNCKMVDCPYSYLPDEFAVDFDRSAAVLGPWGQQSSSMIHNGKCPTDSAFFSDSEVAQLGNCLSEFFDETVAGQFLWTARNELEDKWNYVTAYDKGWLTSRRQHMFLQ